MEEEDYDFGATKSRNAKMGRRARKQAMEEEPADVAGAEEDTLTVESTPARDPDAPPRPSRRMGGWGDDTKKKGNRNRRTGAMEELEDERLRPHTPGGDDSDGDADIPVIPDLEDTQEDDLTTQIAMAPNVAVNRVATYRELDNDLLRHAAFVTLDNEIDLKLLTKGLSSEQDVHEEDRPWDWDRLFTEVTSDLLAETESKEEHDDEELRGL